jgi:UDP-3-O-[3-hydroxymyristoyl] N-acetylglucosamine deacetylase/3-hydroxyacyl-[acyl-carrier-protein] dehydratase
VQRTIAKPSEFSGVGLHTGAKSRIEFKPAQPMTGIIFRREDLAGKPTVQADVDFVVDTSRGTTIGVGDVRVHTVEHVLAAAWCLGIDNLEIVLNCSEPPAGDGSALPFARVIREAGTQDQGVHRNVARLTSPIHYSSDNVDIIALPADDLRISFTICYNHPHLQSQYNSFAVSEDSFLEELAPARTYCFANWVQGLKEQGLAKGGSLENSIIIGDDGILNPEPLRFEDEFVRHKIVDLLGDLALLGRPIKAHIIALCSGHRPNISFVKQLKRATTADEAVLDIHEIQRILPHRYPFLLVDRILELESDRVVGIKNVTASEPFFQGHFPDHPIMPGVLIVESMAQTGGFLLLNLVEDKVNKVVYFLAIDKVRFRRPVRPGDQIRSELTMVSFRRDICKMRGKAWVGSELVCEGEFTAKVVPR